MDGVPADALKQRELVFSGNPPGQAERAFELLSGLDDLRVERGARPNSLLISYSLLNYSLEGLERALIGEDFRLEDSAINQIAKKLTYYREEVEYHNLNVPERHVDNRRNAEIFVKAYDRHLHGDHDDTPPELREYR